MKSPSMHSIRHEIRMVTPSDAQAWLLKTRSERRLNRQQIRAYSEDMRSGKWMLNGDPIIFAKSGEVLSGVLRLQACVDADRAFPCLVIEGVDDKHYETIDSVRRRTVADILTIRKEPRGRILAAALMVLWRYGDDDYVATRRKPSANSLLQILENNPSIRDSLKLAEDASSLMSLAVAAALHYLFSRADATRADQFFELLLDEDLSAGPIFLLRQQLTRLDAKRGAKSQGLLIALCIKAWEAFRSGEDMKQLRFAQGTDNPPRVSGIDETNLRSGLADETPSPQSPAGIRRTRTAALPKNVQVEVMEITPDIAEEMLALNENNRGMAALVVDKYARDMSRRAWALNGQTIKFGQSGRLLDGQHRLQACVNSKASFPAIVVRGLDDSVFDTFDLGGRRAIGDILKDRDELNTSTLGSALRQLWLLENGLVQSRGASPTVADLLDVLEKNGGLRESVRLAHKVREITAPTIILALHYLFTKVDTEKAAWFIDRLSDGVELGHRHPILTLRDQLMRARNNGKVSLPDSERAAWTIKAWNAYLEDRKVAALKWQQLGPRKETFPEIAGLPRLRRSMAA